MVELDPASHDEAVALVSHLPQVAASLVAARLVGAPGAGCGPGGAGPARRHPDRGQRPRPVGADPRRQRRPAGAPAAAARHDLDRAVDALEALAADGPPEAPAQASVGALARLVAEGNAGRATVPGKHGEAPAVWSRVGVLVPDRPGALASLIGAIGEVGVNIEDLRIEHSPGRLTGVAEVAVLPAERDRLVGELRDRGWSVPD